MVVCSCNYITTEDIRAVAQYATEPSEKQILNMLVWEPKCSYCGKMLVDEIRRVFKEINNQSLTQGE